MAVPNINFRGSGKTIGGKFTPMNAKKILDSQFKGLTPSARAYMMDKLGSGKIIHSTDFSKIVTEAHKKGYLSSSHAEMIKDAAHLPDKGNFKGVNFNDHWK